MAKRKSTAPSTVKRKRTRSRTSKPRRTRRNVRRRKIVSRRSRGNQRRSRVSSIAGSTAGDRQDVARVYGRKATGMKMIRKLVMVGTTYNLYRLQNIARYGADQGQVRLSRQLQTVIFTGQPGVTGNYEELPIYFIELTNRGDNSIPTVWKMWRADVSGALNYRTYFSSAEASQTSAGPQSIGAGSWLLEKGDGSPTTNFKDLLSWTELKLDCIGPQSESCKWTASVVQFTENFYHPRAVSRPSTSFPDVDTLDDNFQARNQLYDALSRPLTSHPFDVQHNDVLRKGMKVIKRMSFVTEPKETTDKDTTGQNRMIKMFLWLNRKLDFAWSSADTAPPLAANGSDIGWAVDDRDDSVLLQPRAQMYFMLTAENTNASLNSNTATNPDKCPSFNYCIRKKHIQSH